MLPIILCGHGRWASGCVSCLAMVIGEQERLIAIDFLGDSDAFKAQLQTAYDNFADATATPLFICDFLGGTPFQAASLIAMKEGAQVLAGLGLPALLALLPRRTGLSAEDFCQEALALNVATTLSMQLAKNNDDFEGDGI